ncbi:MAG: TrkA C-terminal domain-containing protein, partial [Coriobacteriia bacterium]|nr:TrkA C-terminal domain-containing protein [Coriobacteriia bacterium]
AAEVARKIFNVPHAVARLYNPVRERTYQQLGLDYVCGTTLVAETLLDKIMAGHGHHLASVGDVEVVQFKASAAVEGKTVDDIEIDRRFRIAVVARGESMFVPEPGTVLHAGDVIVAAVKDETFPKLERFMEE